MPLTQSAIKRMRQNRVRNARLLPFRTHMKTMMRKISDAAKEGKKDEVVKLLPGVYKAIDMAAKKQIIHKKNASHKKAKMAKLAAAKE
ncbi:30S ribosomal protein S20 [Candidatus Peregrinibacteria bacterium]|nr:30S ribosomal protein S20 [Candidatus Peregrinibacteria bacterium]